MVLALLVLLACRPPAAQADPSDKDQYNVDFRVGWDGCYRPMRWTPVEISISTNLKEPLAGAVSIEGPQDSLASVCTRQPAVLTPDLPLYVPMVTKLDFYADHMTLRLADEKGRTRWNKDYNLWAQESSQRFLTAVPAADVLIGVTGQRNGGGRRGGLNFLPQHATIPGAGAYSGRGQTVHLAEKLPHYLPWDWTGYDGLDLLVLYDLDWSALRPEQARAIAQWVSRGGQLLIVPGSQPLPADHPLAALLPFGLSKPVQVTLSGAAIRSVSLPAQNLGDRPFNRWLTRAAVQSAGWTASDGGDLFLATGPSGFGRVGVLSGNPAEVAADNFQAAEFWAKQLNLVMHQESDRLAYQASEVESSYDNYRQYERLYAAGEIGPTNELLAGLLAIRELEPLNFWWVLALFAVLAVAIGPLDYLVLKKLDRLPWTWVTCSAALILFTAGAYYGVQALRAGPMQVRSVTVIDGIQPPAAGGSAAAPARASGWATDYVGIFASGSGDFTLTGVAQSQWWSTVAPTREENRYYYGGGGGRDNLLARRISCVQADGGNLPDSLPISIWSMQCLVAERAVPSLPISAKVTKDSNGEWTASLTNHADVPVQSGYVKLPFPPRSENWGLGFKAIPPKGTIQVHGRGEYLGQWGGQDTACFEAAGIVQRTRAIRAMKDEGVAVVTAKYDQPVGPVSVKGKACQFDHAQWVRLVVPVPPAGPN